MAAPEAPAEGTVQWKEYEDFIKGKKAESDAEDDQAGDEGEEGEKTAEELREFRYRGRVLKVDPETADMLESLRKEARGTNGRLGSELAAAKERLAKLEGKLEARGAAEERTELRPPDPNLALKNFPEYQRQHDEYIQAREVRLRAELEERHNREVQTREERLAQQRKDEAWANRFYAEYEHLDDPDVKPLVAQIYDAHEEELKSLGDDDEARERLAEIVDTKLIRLRKGSGETTPRNPRRPPRVESSAGPTPGVSEKEKTRTFNSASWAARQKAIIGGRAVKKE